MAKIVAKEKMIIRILKIPIRALAKARDFYVNSMISCAGPYGNAFAPTGVYTLPRSYSSTSSKNADEDLHELIKASSSKMLKMRGVVNDGILRSQSVGIGRIDEDKPCEFDGEFLEVKVPKSRSYAVNRRTMV